MLFRSIHDVFGSFGGGYSSSGSAGVKVACPSTFVCNGKGTDGYHLDVEGNGVPGASCISRDREAR